MALTRKFLEAMSLSGEQIQAIIDEHTSVTDALKAQRDKYEQEAQKYKTEAEKVPELETKLKGYEGKADFEEKFNAEHKAFEDYKAQIAREAETEKVKAAYRQLLLDENISEKRVPAVLKLTDFSEMKLDKEGKLENLDALKKSIGEEWSDYKVTRTERKQFVATPPRDNTGSAGSRAREIYMNHLKQQGIKTNDAGEE